MMHGVKTGRLRNSLGHCKRVVGTALAIGKGYNPNLETIMAKHPAPATWSTLLQDATTKPGHMATCYRVFHRYSLGNVMLAAWQCADRGLSLGPIGTYNKWLDEGRQVRKGEKSIILCIPIKAKRQIEDPDTGEIKTIPVTIGFTYRKGWFVLSQTDGDDVPVEDVPDWDLDAAMTKLNITRCEFDYPDGNAQGFARERSVALNPVAQHPMRTMLHEIAHIMLGHTDTKDLCKMPITIAELEAEAVAYLIADTFGLDGASESRGYIQHWFGKGKDVPEESAQRIFKVAQQILDAGKDASAGEQTEAA